jgi:hypothetical protein
LNHRGIEARKTYIFKGKDVGYSFEFFDRVHAIQFALVWGSTIE